MNLSDLSRRDRKYFAQRKRQARIRERTLGAAAAMDLAFLNRARKFVEQRGLYTNPKVRAALAELEFETADLIKKQS